jgi:hypothetical protein
MSTNFQTQTYGTTSGDMKYEEKLEISLLCKINVNFCLIHFQTIQGIDYENELDILAVTAVNQKEDAFQGMVRFHDNTNGQILKEIVLEEPWKEVSLLWCQTCNQISPERIVLQNFPEQDIKPYLLLFLWDYTVNPEMFAALKVSDMDEQ